MTGEMLPEGCNRVDFRDPKIWKENDTYYMIVGNKNENQIGQVVLCSSKNLTDWKFETILASNESGKIGTMWECPDFFQLGSKRVLICSPQDMKAQKYEFHNGHNSVYFLGDYDEKTHTFVKELPHALDYGMDFYAPQTTELPDGRRIMIAWMKSWDACVIPNSQVWQGMMTLPRELELKDGKIWQTPVREIEKYHKNPCRYDHAEINQETTLCGIEGRTIDLTVLLEEDEFQTFSMKLAANKEYETSFTYHKAENMLEIDRTYCGVTKDVVCVRKLKISNPEGLKKMRFILDRQSIELFLNDGEQVATTAICTGALGRDIEMEELQGSLAADGFSSAISGCFGCLPLTSFSQNIGLVTMTGVINRFTILMGALILILASLFPPLGAFFNSLPQAVLGGCTVMMFGSIMYEGIKMLKGCVFDDRTMIIVSLAFCIGVGLTQTSGNFFSAFPKEVGDIFNGNAVAGVFVVSLILSICLPKKKTTDL